MDDFPTIHVSIIGKPSVKFDIQHKSIVIRCEFQVWRLRISDKTKARMVYFL